MTTVAIIQARMNSTRLPGKVLRPICGETMLFRVVQRVRRAKLLDKIVVATTVESIDDLIVAACNNLQVTVFRGSEIDVLDRYYQAALAFDADAIVRITSDCPLIDPSVIDQVVQEFFQKSPDYASNNIIRTYPRGLDTEVIAQPTLARTWRETTKPYQRAHVTPYIYQNPQLFHLVSVQSAIDFSQYRWTVDTAEDLQLVQAIYSRLADNPFFNWHDVVDMLEGESELQALNQHIAQKSLEEG